MCFHGYVALNFLLITQTRDLLMFITDNGNLEKKTTPIGFQLHSALCKQETSDEKLSIIHPNKVAATQNVQNVALLILLGNNSKDKAQCICLSQSIYCWWQICHKRHGIGSVIIAPNGPYFVIASHFRDSNKNRHYAYNHSVMEYQLGRVLKDHLIKPF